LTRECRSRFRRRIPVARGCDAERPVSAETTRPAREGDDHPRGRSGRSPGRPPRGTPLSSRLSLPPGRPSPPRPDPPPLRPPPPALRRPPPALDPCPLYPSVTTAWRSPLTPETGQMGAPEHRPSATVSPDDATARDFPSPEATTSHRQTRSPRRRRSLPLWPSTLYPSDHPPHLHAPHPPALRPSAPAAGRYRPGKFAYRSLAYTPQGY
jgi:hypothetical protein